MPQIQDQLEKACLFADIANSSSALITTIGTKRVLEPLVHHPGSTLRTLYIHMPNWELLQNLKQHRAEAKVLGRLRGVQQHSQRPAQLLAGVEHACLVGVTAHSFAMHFSPLEHCRGGGGWRGALGMTRNTYTWLASMQVMGQSQAAAYLPTRGIVCWGARCPVRTHTSSLACTLARLHTHTHTRKHTHTRTHTHTHTSTHARAGRACGARPPALQDPVVHVPQPARAIGPGLPRAHASGPGLAAHADGRAAHAAHGVRALLPGAHQAHSALAAAARLAGAEPDLHPRICVPQPGGACVCARRDRSHGERA